MKEYCSGENDMDKNNVNNNRTEEAIIEELRNARLSHPLNANDFSEAELETMKEYAPREVEILEKSYGGEVHKV